VKIAVVDLGFDGYRRSQANGDLPASVVKADFCPIGGFAATSSTRTLPARMDSRCESSFATFAGAATGRRRSYVPEPEPLAATPAAASSPHSTPITTRRTLLPLRDLP